jgi:O-acetyl-ADP-ribose deacetylase (regulator of RNase III)
MKIFLRDRNPELVRAWQQVFAGNNNIKASCGDIFQEGEHLDVMSIVSPANSFGYMDGGIDFVYSEYFGWGIGDNLRAKIWTEFDGELLVGQAAVIDMRETLPHHPQHNARVNRTPYLISAPTMRVPMKVGQTVNAFLAFRAALRAAKAHKIDSMLCPGLGTAIGAMEPRVCAVQMLEAYKQFLQPKFHDVLGNAHALHHSMLNADTYLGSR